MLYRQISAATLALFASEATAFSLAPLPAQAPSNPSSPSASAGANNKICMNEAAAREAWLAKQEPPASWDQFDSKASAIVAAAKARWLAKLDAPVWGKTAAAMTAVVHAATEVSLLTEACIQGDDDACEALSHEEDAKRKWLQSIDRGKWGQAAAAVSIVATEVSAGAPISSANTDLEEAESTWLANLDEPTLREAASAVTALAESADDIEAMAEACDNSVEEACDAMAREAMAKRTWLASLNIPAWNRRSEAAAKATWLAKAEKPKWGRTAAAMAQTASAATGGKAMTEACVKGDDVACDMLSQEENAKLEWLTGGQEAPPATIGQEPVAEAIAMPSRPAPLAMDAARDPEETRDPEPSIIPAAVALPQESEEASALKTSKTALLLLTEEEASKAAWLAKQASSAWGTSPGILTANEEASKRKWLAKQEGPSWGYAPEARVAAPPTPSLMPPPSTATAIIMAPTYSEAMEAAAEACDKGVQEGCDILEIEEEAKRRWLASLDVPGAWEGRTISEAAAKAAWLAKQETPTWGMPSSLGRAAASMPPVPLVSAPIPPPPMPAEMMEAMAEACDVGVAEACEAMAREDEARRKWLASLSVPGVWGSGNPAAAAPASEAAAKAAWLAKIEAPKWGQTTVAVAAEAAANQAASQATANLGDAMRSQLDAEMWADDAKAAWVASQAATDAAKLAAEAQDLALEAALLEASAAAAAAPAPPVQEQWVTDIAGSAPYTPPQAMLPPPDTIPPPPSNLVAMAQAAAAREASTLREATHAANAAADALLAAKEAQRELQRAQTAVVEKKAAADAAVRASEQALQAASAQQGVRASFASVESVVSAAEEALHRAREARDAAAQASARARHDANAASVAVQASSAAFAAAQTAGAGWSTQAAVQAASVAQAALAQAKASNAAKTAAEQSAEVAASVAARALDASLSAKRALEGARSMQGMVVPTALGAVDQLKQAFFSLFN